MWVFSVDGFFSAVEHRGHPELVLVRARYKEDLENLRQKIGLRFRVEDMPKADYPYRLGMTKKKWAEYVNVCALGIDYDNFKNAVLKSANLRRNAQYHGVWATMAGYNYYDDDDLVAIEAEKTFDEPLHQDTDLSYSEAIRKTRKMVEDGIMNINAFQMSTMLSYIYGKTKEETLSDLVGE